MSLRVDPHSDGAHSGWLPNFYLALLAPPVSLNFCDQYTFCLTGSTTAAPISLLHTVTDFLLHNPYVTFIVLGFSKAFDTVRHS